MPALNAKLLRQLGMGAASLTAVRTLFDRVASCGGGRGARGVGLVEGGLTEDGWPCGAAVAVDERRGSKDGTVGADVFMSMRVVSAVPRDVTCGQSVGS